MHRVSSQWAVTDEWWYTANAFIGQVHALRTAVFLCDVLAGMTMMK